MKRKLSLIFAVLMLMQLCSKAQTVEPSSESDSVISTITVPVPGKGVDADDTSTSAFAKDVLGDTSVNFRSFVIPEDTVRFWKEKKEYKWIKNLDSLLRNEQEKANKQPGTVQKPSAPRKEIDLGFFSIILWVLAGGFVVFILVKLFMSGGAFTSGGKKVKNAEEETEEYIEDINEKDYQALKRKAYATGDLRLATRYIFLFTLQQLQQREQISFSPDKTNSMYLNELPQHKRSGFAQLSLYYEYIWYGNAHVEREQFDAIELRFNEFLNKG